MTLVLVIFELVVCTAEKEDAEVTVTVKVSIVEPVILLEGVETWETSVPRAVFVWKFEEIAEILGPEEIEGSNEVNGWVVKVGGALVDVHVCNKVCKGETLCVNDDCWLPAGADEIDCNTVTDDVTPVVSLASKDTLGICVAELESVPIAENGIKSVGSGFADVDKVLIILPSPKPCDSDASIDWEVDGDKDNDADGDALIDCSTFGDGVDNTKGVADNNGDGESDASIECVDVINGESDVMIDNDGKSDGKRVTKADDDTEPIKLALTVGAFDSKADAAIEFVVNWDICADDDSDIDELDELDAVGDSDICADDDSDMDELDELDAVGDSAALAVNESSGSCVVDGEPDIERDSAAEILEDALTETLVVGDDDSIAETDSDVELVCESEAITVNDWNGAETLAAEVGEIVNVPIDVVDAEIELDELNDGLGEELDDADEEIVSPSLVCNTAANVNTISNCECRFILSY